MDKQQENTCRVIDNAQSQNNKFFNFLLLLIFWLIVFFFWKIGFKFWDEYKYDNWVTYHKRQIMEPAAADLPSF